MSKNCSNLYTQSFWPNSYKLKSISWSSKLKSFFRLLRCDRGSNAVVLNTHIGYFQRTWIFTFLKVFQIFNYRGRHNAANEQKIWVCWTEKSTKTLKNLVIMIGCTDLNSFRTFSRADKLRSFFCLLRCDRGLNAVILNTHIGFFWATWIFTFVQVFQIFKLRPRKLKIWNFIFSPFRFLFLFLFIRAPLLVRA